ncbi:acp-3, partial [Pristionchus pacificus]
QIGDFLKTIEKVRSVGSLGVTRGHPERSVFTGGIARTVVLPSHKESMPNQVKLTMFSYNCPLADLYLTSFSLSFLILLKSLHSIMVERWLLLFSLIFSFFTPLLTQQLLFVQALWRHGERAGNKGDSLHDKTLFKYGIGELTEAGINNTYNVGRWLRHRYIDTDKFLSPVMNPKELYIQSVDVSRCLMSAESVGQGMFNADGRYPPLPVPVHSRPRDSDWMLAFKWSNCDGLGREFSRICSDYPIISLLSSYNDYEGESFRCSNASNNASFFNTAEKYQLIEPLIALDLAGAKLPDWYTPELRNEAREVSDKALRFQLGLGEFHNKRILRFSTGLLIDTLQKELLHKWKCSQIESFDPNCAAIQPIKFRAFSTQDFVLNSLLETLGKEARIEALSPLGHPQYNALILIELWNIEGSPKVKILYRPDAYKEEATVITPFVRGCSNEYCSLDLFDSCCREIRTSNPKDDCDNR